MAIFVSTCNDTVTTSELCIGTGVTGSTGSPRESFNTPPSMAEPVTRHAPNPPAGNFQFLLCGIDTLDLGLYVKWDANWKAVCSLLEENKEASKGTKGLLDKTDIGREFLHLPGGKPPNYRYQLHFPEFRFYISISDEYQDTPNVYVTILSSVLWHENLSTILDLLEFDLSHFGGTIESIQPSRCDLCADFKLEAPPSFSFLESHRVSLTRKTRVYLGGDMLETYYSGAASSPAQTRIYDKGKEIQESNKQWFLPMWGLNDPTNVWRVEFQLRRPFLHSYRIKTLDDLWQKIGDMWGHLTMELFSLKIPDNDKAERRTIHPWWEAVQGCGERFGDLSGAKRTFTSDSMEPIQRSLAHICGRLVSIAAQKGIKDRAKAILHLEELIYARMDDEKFRSEYKKKSIKLGYLGKIGGTDDDEL